MQDTREDPARLDEAALPCPCQPAAPSACGMPAVSSPRVRTRLPQACRPAAAAPSVATRPSGLSRKTSPSSAGSIPGPATICAAG